MLSELEVVGSNHSWFGHGTLSSVCSESGSRFYSSSQHFSFRKHSQLNEIGGPGRPGGGSTFLVPYYYDTISRFFVYLLPFTKLIFLMKIALVK